MAGELVERSKGSYCLICFIDWIFWFFLFPFSLN